VVLKILSRDITHKSDVGGVQLNLASSAAERQAATDMLRKVHELADRARIDGFTVQPMVRRPGAHELLLGVAEDSVFGPVVLFGHGGTAVEVLRDRVVGIPPLNLLLARDMIERTQVHRLLRGYRDRPPANIEAIATTLVRLSQLVTWLDRIVELDINPLLADPNGVIALDARIVVSERDRPRRPLAIRPYPRELEAAVETGNGARFHLRPILPEDESRLIELLTRSKMEDLRLRFFAPIKEFGHQFAARLTQIDYDREMALVATELESGAIAGVVRLISDPDNEKAEFAVLVRSDLKGKGLGYSLMTSILDYARQRGIGRVHGDILSENTTMLRIARELGFSIVPQSGDPELVTVTLDTGRAAQLPTL
jgi:acetyltransferase